MAPYTAGPYSEGTRIDPEFPNKIYIVFDPTRSTKVRSAEKIAIAQVCRMLADGKPVKPGDYQWVIRFEDEVTTESLYWLDFTLRETTPDYQQGEDSAEMHYGYLNDVSARSAAISDAPWDGGGNKGFYDPEKNPEGWREFRLECETFAYCMDGEDKGRFYEGMQWEFVKSWQDYQNGKLGKARIIDLNLDAPSKSFVEAFDLFVKVKGKKP